MQTSSRWHTKIVEKYVLIKYFSIMVSTPTSFLHCSKVQSRAAFPCLVVQVLSTAFCMRVPKKCKKNEKMEIKSSTLICTSLQMQRASILDKLQANTQQQDDQKYDVQNHVPQKLFTCFCSCLLHWFQLRVKTQTELKCTSAVFLLLTLLELCTDLATATPIPCYVTQGAKKLCSTDVQHTL